ncbi:uncharacterized protein LOC126841675 [Adelges cooleyi]|uniref:uncharacterized protein LOC126841675 n=1 Tax=Adelges cooleyi TaxID=133065 RepID=UPI002180626E|nr:uncharacterized protein LOC126841675 [Adelges cooleyi]
MKLFCLLISLFFVEVLAPYDLYMKLVHLTTIGIKLAYEKNDLTVGSRSRLNGLEYLIETMVDNVNNDPTYQDFRIICFLMAVPDHTEILLGRTDVNDLFDKMLADLLSEIEIDMRVGRFAVENTLKNLAYLRREHVAWSLKNLIRRRILGSEQDVISLPNCRLLGMYWSTQNPMAYINEVNIDSTSSTCTLNSCASFETTIRKIGGTWTVRNRYGTVITLEENLQQGHQRTAPTY